MKHDACAPLTYAAQAAELFDEILIEQTRPELIARYWQRACDRRWPTQTYPYQEWCSWAYDKWLSLTELQRQQWREQHRTAVESTIAAMPHCRAEGCPAKVRAQGPSFPRLTCRKHNHAIFAARLGDQLVSKEWRAGIMQTDAEVNAILRGHGILDLTGK